MKYEATVNESFVVAILMLLQKQMAASKSEKYSLSKIVRMLPDKLKNEVEYGINAGIDIGLFAMDGNDIYVTKDGEQFKLFIYAGTQSADAAKDFANTYPEVNQILAAIERDPRLNPSKYQKLSSSQETNQPLNEESHRNELMPSGGEIVITGEAQLSPENFGLIVVKRAIDSTVADAMDIIGSNETAFRKAIAAKARGVHILLIALHCRPQLYMCTRQGF
ncbi:MAG: hypothetical protein PHY62_03095 [Gallionella sp.]|nr:hypothetical protein [Gallionella sp.]